jgi:hypothetical protein
VFHSVLEILLVGTPKHELWHPEQLLETWLQARAQEDDSTQLRQEPLALLAQQIVLDSLQDLTSFRKGLLC